MTLNPKERNKMKTILQINFQPFTFPKNYDCNVLTNYWAFAFIFTLGYSPCNVLQSHFHCAITVRS